MWSLVYLFLSRLSVSDYTTMKCTSHAIVYQRSPQLLKYTWDTWHTNSMYWYWCCLFHLSKWSFCLFVLVSTGYTSKSMKLWLIVLLVEKDFTLHVIHVVKYKIIWVTHLMGRHNIWHHIPTCAYIFIQLYLGRCDIITTYDLTAGLPSQYKMWKLKLKKILLCLSSLHSL